MISFDIGFFSEVSFIENGLRDGFIRLGEFIDYVFLVKVVYVDFF